jgi:hypothetical protein
MLAIIVRTVAGVCMFLLPGFAAAHKGVRETIASPQLLPEEVGGAR